MKLIIVVHIFLNKISHFIYMYIAWLFIVHIRSPLMQLMIAFSMETL